MEMDYSNSGQTAQNAGAPPDQPEYKEKRNKIDERITFAIERKK